MEIKRILNMGEKKIVIIPKKSELKVGETVMIDSLDNIQDSKKAIRKLMEDL